MSLPTPYALIGSSCLADSHPPECTEPAPGDIVNSDSNNPLTVDGTVVADHGDRMDYPKHAHEHKDIDGDNEKECTNKQPHSLVPDQTNPWTIDGRSLMKVGDDTTDPGSGGRAWIDSTSQSAFELVD